MKRVAVTIGVGEEYLFYAQKAAERVRVLLGVETRIITDEHMHLALGGQYDLLDRVYSLKLRIFDIFSDIDQVLYFDCDWRPVRSFEWPDIGSKIIGMCLDRDNDHCHGLEDKYGLRRGTYNNAGFFVANKKGGKELFDFCFANYDKYERKWMDQCVLNQVLNLPKFKGKCATLNKAMNVMDLYTSHHESNVLAYHSSDNYRIYRGETDYDWNTTVEQRIMGWNDSEPWATSRQHFTELYHLGSIIRRMFGTQALEVGTYTGMGAMAIRLSGLNVKTIDITEEFQAKCKELWGAWHIDWEQKSGEDELKDPTQYGLIFHDSYHGDAVIPELVKFFKTKLKHGGALAVHDVDTFDLNKLLEAIKQPYYTITTDDRGRKLGVFYKH